MYIFSYNVFFQIKASIFLSIYFQVNMFWVSNSAPSLSVIVDQEIVTTVEDCFMLLECREIDT